MTFTEDRVARFDAYGLACGSGEDGNDLAAIDTALMGCTLVTFPVT